MRQSNSLLLIAASLLLPGAALAADYNQNSSSGNAVQVEITNSGSTSKTGIYLGQTQPYSTGIDVQVGDGTGAATGVNVYNGGVGYDTQGYGYRADGRVDGQWGTYYGLYSFSWAQGYESYNYGVRTQAGGASDTYNYGIYGQGYVYGSGGFGAAGYFAGDVWASSYNTISDRKFKKDIQDYSDGLNTIMALKPRTYNWREEEYKDQMTFSKGKQIGFIAQELQEVLPELVKDAVEPPRLTEEERKQGVKKQGVKYKSVDYTGVIPVLVKAVQEQQAEIATLRAELASLKAAK